MTDPYTSNSLLIRIKISKVNFENFLKAKPKQPKLNSDWEEWWDSKELNPKVALTQSDVFGFDDLTNKDLIDAWLNENDLLAFSDYDENSNIWHFGIIKLTETYYNLIPIIAFVKSISSYKEVNSEDFAIIYEFLCSSCNQVAAFIKFEGKKSFFDNKIQTKDDIKSDIYYYIENYLMDKLEMD